MSILGRFTALNSFVLSPIGSYDLNCENHGKNNKLNLTYINQIILQLFKLAFY